MKWNRYLGSLGASILVIVACNPNGLSLPTPPPAPDSNDCAAACANLKSLGCSVGNPIDMHTSCHVAADCRGPSGQPDPSQTCSAVGGCMTTCTSFCQQVEGKGVWLQPSCVKNVTACSQVNACLPDSGR